MGGFHFMTGFRHGPLKADLVAAIFLGTLIGVLGLWPHLLLMHRVGGFAFFNGAYDEPTYALGWLRGTLRSTRLLSEAGFGAVYVLGGFSVRAALVLSDFIFPFMAACAAYFAASRICQRVSLRMLSAILLVFANDLFSLGNLAVWHSGDLTLSVFSQLVSHIGANLVPPYETSYLAVFRTPEPQASFALMFLVLGLLAHLAQGREGRVPLAATVVAISLLPLGYTFVTLPVAAVAACCVPAFAFCDLRRAALATAAGMAGALAVAAGAVAWQHAGAQSSAGLAAMLSYPSRLPVITPAVIASVGLGGLFGLSLLGSGKRSALAFLALACLAMPLLIDNQQVITGFMISARDWERNFNYPALVFGALAALAARIPLPAALRAPRYGEWAGWLACLAAAVVLVRAERQSIGYWMPQNLESVAARRALDSAAPKPAAGTPLVLEESGLGPLVELRTDGAANILMDFYHVGIDLVPNMAPDATEAGPSPYETVVFEYWLRTGITPEEAEKLLHAEIERAAGTYINFLFSFRDAWYPASDNRAVRRPELERSVAPLIARYRSYLDPANRAAVLAHPAILVSSNGPEALRKNPWVRNAPLGQGSAGPAAVFLYRQQPL